MNVLFVCIAAGAHAALSAGSNPAPRVHPEVVAVMQEVDIDVSDCVPHRLSRADAEWADVVVTMGCGALVDELGRAGGRSAA